MSTYLLTVLTIYRIVRTVSSLSRCGARTNVDISLSYQFFYGKRKSRVELKPIADTKTPILRTGVQTSSYGSVKNQTMSNTKRFEACVLSSVLTGLSFATLNFYTELYGRRYFLYFLEAVCIRVFHAPLFYMLMLKAVFESSIA